MARPRSPSHRPARSLLGMRAGASAPAAKPAPGTPRSMREFKQRTKRLMEERLKRRNRALAKRLGLLPPQPPPARPKLPKPPPVAVSRQQIAKQERQRKLRAIWDDMEATGTDRLDLAPRTGPPTWDSPAPAASTPVPSGHPPEGLKRSAATSDAEIRSLHPAPPSPRSDAEREEYDRLFEIERAKADDLRRIDDAVSAFKSRLTPGQVAARVDLDFDRFCVAEHHRLYGNRGDRRYWR